jgi:hypothetical protein
VRLAYLLALVSAAFVLAALAGESGTATAGSTSACGLDADGNGYTYAGHQSTTAGHGVRATITPTRALNVAAGHVAGWVGVGGPGQGVNGEDAWLQVGIASVEETQPFVYAEIARDGRQPQFMLLQEGLRIGESHRLALLEMSGRPGWWQVWVDGNPKMKPLRIEGSSGRWAPIATAESWDGGRGACNRFAFRFERVSVSYGSGGSWRPFVPGYQFLDGGNQLRSLEQSAPAAPPYAFVASS